MAEQLLLDLYGCDSAALDDEDAVRQLSHRIVNCVGATILHEFVHGFDPVGITYVAILSTSHLAIHTWPENGCAAIDVFSCATGIPDAVVTEAADVFQASKTSPRFVERHTEGEAA